MAMKEYGEQAHIGIGTAGDGDGRASVRYSFRSPLNVFPYTG